jgi:hypothetical protein
MNSQFYAAPIGGLAMQFGHPVRIEHQAGDVVVRSGRVWLTRRGDPDDHVLEAGQRVRLAAGDTAVVEPWQRGEPTVIDWHPAQRRPVRVLPRDAAAFGLRGVAFAADRLAGGFAALARNAASMARRAQGCIC